MRIFLSLSLIIALLYVSIQNVHIRRSPELVIDIAGISIAIHSITEDGKLQIHLTSTQYNKGAASNIQNAPSLTQHIKTGVLPVRAEFVELETLPG